MKKEIYYAAMFSQDLVDSMVAQDNGKLWNPVAVFKDPLEAARWRAEKYLGELDKSLIKKVKITILE